MTTDSKIQELILEANQPLVSQIKELKAQIALLQSKSETATGSSPDPNPVTAAQEQVELAQDLIALDQADLLQKHFQDGYSQGKLDMANQFSVWLEKAGGVELRDEVLAWIEKGHQAADLDATPVAAG